MNILEKKLLSVAMVTAMLISGLSIITTGAEARTDGASITAAHGVIRINDDADFATTASSEGWAGDGSAGNPYAIENYEIDALGGGNAIYIGNTTSYFVIRNCTLYNASSVSDPYFDGSGISLHSEVNGLIYNNTIYSVKHGLYFYESASFNTVRNNSISGSMFGLYLEQNSDSNNITDNAVESSTIGGLFLSLSTGNRIDGNNISGSGLYGVRIHNAKQNTIVNNSICDNKEGMWFELNSDRNIVRNNSIINSWNNYGIDVDGSVDNLIIENTVTRSGAYPGIYLINTNGTVVENNTVLNNKFGIYLELSFNATIQENNVSLNSNGGIFASQADGSVFANNTVSDNGQSGIYIGTSSACSVTNNTISSNANAGIHLERSPYDTITGNTLTGNGVELWGDQMSGWNTHIIDTTNTVNGKPLYYFKNQTFTGVPSDAGQVIVANCSVGTINGVKIKDSTVSIQIGFSNNITVSNSTLANNSGNSGMGIYVYYSENCTVEKSYINNSYYGIMFSYAKECSARSNTIDANTVGVDIYHSSGVISIDSNTLSNSGEDAIFSQYSTARTQVTNNTLSSNQGDGIYMMNLVHGTIAYNNFTSNQNGMYLRDSNNNSVYGNFIEDSNNFGFLLRTSPYNDIYENTFYANNNYGLYIDTDSPTIYGNRVYHNNFINNTNQAYDNQHSIWNATYPEGGNYWSDYSGTDIFKGPNQDLQGQDGIGDIPYGIDGGSNQDMYPLMRPWNGTLPSDCTPPTVTGTNPINNSLNVSISQQIVVSFSEFMNQSTFNYTSTPDPGGWIESWSSETPVLTLYHSHFEYNTTYTLNITGGSDLGGKELDNIPYTLVFTTERDMAAPYVTITSPANDSYLNTQDITVNWAGGDNETGIDHYEVSLDGGAWQDAANLTTYDFTALSDGNHTVRVRAIDMGGNEKITSVTFNVDTTVPALSITTPANNGFMSSGDVTVIWNGSDENLDHYEVRIDGGSWQSVGTSEDYTFSGLSDGNHTVEVVAFDTAGNANTSSVRFFVDTANPEIIITSPEANQWFNVSTVTVTWVAWDNASSGIDHYWFSANGGTSWTDVGVNTSYTATGLSDGSANFGVRAFDMAGNWFRADISVQIDTIAPSLWINSPANNTATNLSSITVYWSVTGSYNRSEISMDGDSWVYVGGNQSMVFTGLSEGEHMVRIRAVDDAGNWNYTRSVFYVDFTGPSGVVPTYPVDVSVNGWEINFTWTSGSDSLSGIDHYDISIDGGSWKGAGDTPWYVNIAYMKDGGHTFSVRATDRAGNRFITGTASFSIDTMPPSVTVYSPAQNGFWNMSGMEVNWTGLDDSYASDGGSGIEHYEVSVNGGDAVNVGLNTTYDITGMNDGLYNITITVYDNASNHANSTKSFTVDTVSPFITITTPVDGEVIAFFAFWVNWSGSDDNLDHYELKVDNGTWMEKGSSESEFITSSDGLDMLSGSHNVWVRAFDQAGNMQISHVSFIIDADSPEIISYSPTGDNVSASCKISITFSEEINHTSFSIRVFANSETGLHNGTVSWNGTTAIFTPSSEFKKGDTVRVYVYADHIVSSHQVSFDWSFNISSEGGPPAAGVITGTIVDENGSPVAFADIIYNGEVVGQTDENGTFGISLPEGAYNLTITSGNETGEITVNSVGGQTTDMEEVETTMSAPSSGDSSGDSDAGSFLPYLLILVVIMGILAAVFVMKRKGASPSGAEVEEEPEPSADDTVQEDSENQESLPEDETTHGGEEPDSPADDGIPDDSEN